MGLPNDISSLTLLKRDFRMISEVTSLRTESALHNEDSILLSEVNLMAKVPCPIYISTGSISIH